MCRIILYGFVIESFAQTDTCFSRTVRAILLVAIVTDLPEKRLRLNLWHDERRPASVHLPENQFATCHFEFSSSHYDSAMF